MARKQNKKYDESTLDAVKNLMNDRNSYTSREISDLDMARSTLSGFSFSEDDRQYRGNKPEITIPVLNPWMNQVVSTYTSAPFGMGLKSNRQDIQPHRLVFDEIQGNITDIASSALIEQLGVGYTYALVTNEIVDASMNWQQPKIKLIDARKVVVGDCEDPELDDCDIAIVIDVISKSKAKEKFSLDDYELRGSKDILYGYDIVMDTRNQCSVVTVYERIAEGVQLTKIVYDKIVDQVILPITRIPLVRFYGDTCYIEKEAHYRGVYQLVSDMWKLVNYSASEIQARIATAPTANFMGDPAAIAADPEAYETGSERNFLPSKAWNGNDQLPSVTQLNKNLNITELQSAVNGFMGTIQQLLGTVSAEGRQNETAEAVLARKSMAEATVNKYLNNLKKSLKSLGNIVLEMITICYDVPRIVNGIQIPALTDINGIEVTVDDGPIQASQKQKNLQQVMAFYAMAKESNPQAFNVVGPAILALSDIPMDIKQGLAPLFAQNPAQNMQMMQQQIQQSQQQNAQMQQQLTQMQAYIQKLEIMLETEQYKVAAQVQMNAQDNQTDIQKTLMNIDADNKQTQAKIIADQQKTVMKANADLEKARVANRPEMYEVIQDYTPIMNRGRV